jgi:hypothetical protein
MKFIILLFVSLLSIGAAVLICGKKHSLTEDMFLERDTYLNKRIDSLKAMVIDLRKNQDTIKTDLDTLKSGQRIIFDEVKKKSEKTFWNLF